MKKLFLMLAVTMMAATSCGEKNEEPTLPLTSLNGTEWKNTSNIEGSYSRVSTISFTADLWKRVDTYINEGKVQDESETGGKYVFDSEKATVKLYHERIEDLVYEGHIKDGKLFVDQQVALIEYTRTK